MTYQKSFHQKQHLGQISEIIEIYIHGTAIISLP